MHPVLERVERCLEAITVADKLSLSRQALELARMLPLTSDDRDQPAPIVAVAFPPQPRWVTPKQLPRRNPGSLEGRVALLHAIAHIEFCAIHLAWDIVYRFRGLPAAFYRDWIEVAGEETLHFCMIRERLKELGSDYGDLPVHGGLWAVAVDTAADVLARLALVPRYMEARGLDVTPAMIDKFRRENDPASATILERILRDEVGHVAAGSRWFQHLCRQRGLDPETTYFELLKTYLRGAIRGPFNRELRQQAGFSDSELARLEGT